MAQCVEGLSSCLARICQRVHPGAMRGERTLNSEPLRMGTFVAPRRGVAFSTCLARIPTRNRSTLPEIRLDRAFSPLVHVSSTIPRALPWAGMSRAFSPLDHSVDEPARTYRARYPDRVGPARIGCVMRSRRVCGCRPYFRGRAGAASVHHEHLRDRLRFTRTFPMTYQRFSGGHA
jgi:hypothetical protein